MLTSSSEVKNKTCFGADFKIFMMLKPNSYCLRYRLRLLIYYHEIKQFRYYFILIRLLFIILLCLIAFIYIKYYGKVTFTEFMIVINRYIFMFGRDLSFESEYISLIGYVSMCDVHENIEFSGVFDHGSSIIHNQYGFKNIKQNDLVCLTGHQLTNDFLPNFLPIYDNTNITFTIFTWIRPRSFPLELDINIHLFFKQILSNPHIIHIYCIDYDGTLFEHNNDNIDKLSGIPIGIDYHNKLYKYRYGIPKHPSIQENIFKQHISKYLNKKQYKNRMIKIFRDDMSNKRIQDWKSKSKSQISKYLQFIKLNNYSFIKLWQETNITHRIKDIDNSLDFRVLRRNIARWHAFYQLDNELVDYQKDRLSEKDIFEQRSKYVFILSPFGGGIDCYRTWEALIFGHIVITLHSPLDNLYKDLPVIIVNDWSEITNDKLYYWYQKYFFNNTAQNNQNVRNKLTTKYWIKYMKRHSHGGQLH